MSLDVELEPGEEMLLVETMPAAGKNDDPFSLAVSDRALFVQRKKRFAVADPWYVERIPFARVRRVLVAAHSPAWAWPLSALLLAGGLGGLHLIRSGGDPLSHGQLLGYSLAFIAVSFAIPWA